MTENEPGWVEENQLAERLGWVCVKDSSRGVDSEHNWCYFAKDLERVWKTRPRSSGFEWARATFDGTTHYNYKYYTTLERALRGEKDEG